MSEVMLERLAQRLDLASEATALLRGEANVEISGVSEEVLEQQGVKIHIITVLNKEGAARLNKPMGRYVTLTLPRLEHEEELGRVAAVVSDQLRALLPPLAGRTLLVAGLGSRAAIPDALGPRTVELICATRHLFRENIDTSGLGSVATLSPGVLSESGLESAELLAAVCRELHPAALLAVDALAATDMRRVGVTIQMADSGISPGSGVGNRRAGVNAFTMGCPVIAIGVPTVVDSAAIIRETIRCMDDYRGGKIREDFDDEACEYCEQSLLSQFGGKLMVTPKDIDDLVAKVAEILAAAVAMLVHPAARVQNYHDFIK